MDWYLQVTKKIIGAINRRDSGGGDLWGGWEVCKVWLGYAEFEVVNVTCGRMQSYT